MKYINSKTITLALSAFVIMAFTGCDSKTGAPSDEQLVGSPTPVPENPVPGNKAPVAVAGPDRTIVEGDSFTLDGKDSYDSDGEIISYVWSGAGLSKEGIIVHFDSVPYRAEPYIITLTVTDNDGTTNSDTVEITVIAEDADNLPPKAIASLSPKESYNCNDDGDWSTNITLDASLSSDPEGEALSFAWSGTIGDHKESIKSLISNKDSAIASIFVKDLCNQCGEPTSEDLYDTKICGLIFNVDVTDIGNLSDNAQIIARVMWENSLPPAENLPPVADAGPVQTIGICDALVMDGTRSSDSDGNIVSYVWTVADGTIILGEGATATLTLAGRTPGEHIITLTVTDNDGATGTDTVTVTVTGEDEDYDFSYTIVDPRSAASNPHLTVIETNAHTYDEGIFKYWASALGSTVHGDNPGIVNFNFNFPENIEIAYLYATVTTFHFPYSAGTAYLHASNNGSTWEQLLYATPPAIDGYNTQYQNGFLTDALLGTTTLEIRAELHSDGSGYPLTAQFLRWRSTNDKSFKLNVCYEQTEEVVCESNSDCAAGEYCAEGTCRPIN